jgi:hypothetical protein
MAWTTPSTATAGSTALTAAFWNAEVRDRFNTVRSYQNRYARAKRTSGSLTVSSATWVDLDTGLDLVLNASTGDVIEVAVSGVWGVENIPGRLDVVSVVSNSPVNSFGRDAAPDNNHIGIGGWSNIAGLPNFEESISGSFFRTLVSGDISSGTVTLRLRRRTLSPASNKTIYATSELPFEWWARNHGPVTT